MRTVVVGPRRAGKTSLVKSLSKEKRNSYEGPTIAPAFTLHSVEDMHGDTIHMQICDTVSDIEEY